MMEVDDTFESATKAFLLWLSQMGVQISPKVSLVDMRSEGRGRGVVATADLQEDEVIFSVPRSAVLNLHTASNILSEEGSSLPGWLALTSLILTERCKPESRWAPYFDIFPEQLHSLAFWTEAELAELQASTVVGKIGKAEAEDMFVKHVIPSVGGNTLLCHNIASIIMAYAFDIPEDGLHNDEEDEGSKDGEEDLVSDDGEDEKTVLSMVPLADLLNADADRNNAHLCCDNKELEMRTIKPVQKGQEIFNDYGQLPQSDLLRRYGYVTENYAAFDVAELPAKSILDAFASPSGFVFGQHKLLPLTEEQLKLRLELAEREGIYENSYDLCHPGPDGPGIPNELLALLYLLLLDDDHLESIRNSDSSIPSRSKLAADLVGKVLVILLRNREADYATTLEEDEILKRTTVASHREMLALSVRLGEKKVLRKAIEEASAMSGSNQKFRISNGSHQDRSGLNGATKRKGLGQEGAETRKRERLQ